MVNQYKNTAWLDIIGIGEDGIDGLSPMGRGLINNAKLIIGGRRHLSMLPDNITAKKQQWQSPIAISINQLEKIYQSDETTLVPICILASGDPMNHGIGVSLINKFGLDAVNITPHISAFSHICARMGWAMTDVTTISIHGRDDDGFIKYLQPNAKLIILTNDANSATEIAAKLVEYSMGDSHITAFSNMGGALEKKQQNTASNWGNIQTADLNTLAIKIKIDAICQWHSRQASIEDQAFINDGQITKRQIRALTMANLKPYKGGVLWDIGSGSGSIAIEWARAGGKAIAIENNGHRCLNIAANAKLLGVYDDVKIINKNAIDAIGTINAIGNIDLTAPDAIFIGGGINNNDQMLDICWHKLKISGVFAANSITISSEAKLLQLHKKWGGDISRLQVSHIKSLGKMQAWDSAMAVTLYNVSKI